MIGRKSGFFGAAAVATSLALAACAGNSDQDTTRVGGAGVGAAAGCGVGALVGGGVEECLLGAALGGAAGLVVGNEVARRKEQYADWNDLLESEIEETEYVNRRLGDYNERLREEVEDRRRRAARLEAAVASGRATADDQEEELEAVRERVLAAEDALKRVQSQLEVRRALLEEAHTQQAEVDEGELREYGRQVAEMERRVGAFDELVEWYEEVGEQIEEL